MSVHRPDERPVRDHDVWGADSNGKRHVLATAASIWAVEVER